MNNVLGTKFNINHHSLFYIENFDINKPINIIYEGCYLSYVETHNVVNFVNIDDDSGRQKWIIEKCDSKYYIKGVFKRSNYTQYLGCPNRSGDVYLYTSKNKYTAWNIIKTEENYYNIEYAGEKFNINEVSIVVSKYMEDVQWVLAYNDIAIVYNKSSPYDISLVWNYQCCWDENSHHSLQNVVNLPNVGREGNTYLSHIITNYDNIISERTIFVQASPFEHNPTILFGIDNHDKHEEVQPLGLQYLVEKNIPPHEVLDKFKVKTDYGLEYLVLHCNTDLLVEEYSTEFPITFLFDKQRERYSRDRSLVECFFNRAAFTPVKKQVGSNIRFFFCGLFSVTKNKILKYDRDAYCRLNEVLLKDVGDRIDGYILEKLWLHIFED
jgi:hypothetical protein